MKDVGAASDLLKHYDAWLMRCYPVSTRINHVVHDDEECSRPVERAQIQNTLFTWTHFMVSKSPDRMDALVWALTELTDNGEQEILYEYSAIHDISPELDAFEDFRSFWGLKPPHMTRGDRKMVHRRL
jgi:hypothetical protein